MNNYLKLASVIQDPIKFPDAALQQMVKSPNPTMPMEQSLAMGEWMRRQKLRQAAAPTGETDNRTVKDMVVESAQQKFAMENNPGVQNYPQPQMDMRATSSKVGSNFAGGGLVSFADGGNVYSNWVKEAETGWPYQTVGAPLPMSGAEIAAKKGDLNPGDTVFGSVPAEMWQSIKDIPSSLQQNFINNLNKVKSFQGGVRSFFSDPQVKVGDTVAPPTSNLNPMRIPPVAPPGPSSAPSPIPVTAGPPAPKAARNEGIAGARPDLKDFAKDIIGEKPDVQSLDKYYEKQSKLWEKVLGKDGYSEERDQIVRDRERAGANKENSRAYAMLAAAGAMTDVRTPGLAGFLQGLGRAATTATPFLFKGDDDYNQAIKDANRAALEIKKGERAEAAGKLALAEKSFDKAQERLERFNERRMTVLTQLEVARGNNATTLKAAGIQAGAAKTPSGLLGLFKEAGFPQTPEGYRQFMEATSGAKSIAVSRDKAFENYSKQPLLRMQYPTFDSYYAELQKNGSGPIVRSASSIGLE